MKVSQVEKISFTTLNIYMILTLSSSTEEKLENNKNKFTSLPLVFYPKLILFFLQTNLVVSKLFLKQCADNVVFFKHKYIFF